jgi:gentisate 1,2-dioxygenase
MMSLQELNQKLKEQNLIGYWTIPNTSTGFREPAANFRPFLWKWNEIRPALDDAAKFIRPEEAFRRFIGYQHPELKLGTAHTLLMGAQMVRPGEFAPAHRHTMGAIRFVVEGRGAATIVEGEPLPMEPGDLITTPSWTWHDHVNAGDTPIVWLDGADGPMLHFYQAGFANPFHEPQQPVRKPIGWSQKMFNKRSHFAAGVLTPVLTKGDVQPPLETPFNGSTLKSARSTTNVLRPQTAATPASSHYRPPYRYAWKDTEKAFAGMAEAPGDPFDGILLRYSDPVGGGATLPTMDCEIQMFRPGEKGRAHRHTHTVVYHAFRGSGTTRIGDQEFKWQQGDSFVVPLWNFHRHENTSKDPAVFFVMSDKPLMDAIGHYREDATAD